jgi:hypothetical protein
MPPLLYRPETGGVFKLEEWERPAPDARGVALYDRTSGWTSVAAGKLEARKEWMMDQVRKVCSLPLRFIPCGRVESGKLSDYRPHLINVTEHARKHRLIVVARDLSRFIRAEEYDRRTNRLAWPTFEELRKLWDITFKVPLATLWSPDLKEDERHKMTVQAAAEMGRRPGRPSIVDRKAQKIFRITSHIFWYGDTNQFKWQPSLRVLAARFKISPAALSKLPWRPAWPGGPSWFNVFTEGQEPNDSGDYLMKPYSFFDIRGRLEIPEVRSDAELPEDSECDY